MAVVCRVGVGVRVPFGARNRFDAGGNRRGGNEGGGGRVDSVESAITVGSILDPTE